MLRSISLLLGILFCGQTIAADYALTIYRGKYSDNALVDEILILKHIKYEDSYLLAMALSKPFSWPSNIRQWEFEAQIVKHFNTQQHWEVNTLFVHRWKNYSWDHLLKTTFAIGNGLSYASQIPVLEKASHTNTRAAKFLNYLLLEATFQLPNQNNWALIARIHHRSGVFGTFNNVKGGSNHISLGVKWSF